MAWPPSASPWASDHAPRGGGALAWLRTTAALVRRRALLKKTPDDHRHAAATAPGGELPRVLSRADLALLALASVVSASPFALTGVAAADHGGPSVVAGYGLAGGAALLIALCVTEFAVALPIAGGAAAYCGVVFGELCAVVVGAQMVLEYAISAALLARSASAHVGALAGLDPGRHLIHVGTALSLDPAAAALVLALAALLARGAARSASVNATVTLVFITASCYVLLAGAPLADGANLRPFFPGGARGVAASAGLVFYAFVGVDAVANAAEEARDPAADLPVAIVASVAGAAALYAALAAVLVAAVPRGAIDHGAPYASMFAAAAARAGSPAARVLLATSARFVSFGVVAGLASACLITLMGLARVVVVLARERLLPLPLAAVDAASGAPVTATWATAAAAAGVALTVDVGELAALVSAGSLTAAAAVAAALIKRRHSPPGGGGRAAAAIAALVVTAAAASAALTFGAPLPVVAAAAAAWCAAVVGLHALPVACAPAGFRVPLCPLTPALAVTLAVHLAMSLGARAAARVGAVTVAALAWYAAYSVHSAAAADAAGGRCTASPLDAGRRDPVSLELAVAAAAVPPPLARSDGDGGDHHDRLRLLTVTRLASEEGGSTPALGLRAVPVSPTASDGGSVEGGDGAKPAARGPSRLSK